MTGVCRLLVKMIYFFFCISVCTCEKRVQSEFLVPIEEFVICIYIVVFCGSVVGIVYVVLVTIMSSVK